MANDIEHGINELGDRFRGLWVSTTIKKGMGYHTETGWAVTFSHKNNMVETEYFSTPQKALESAIDWIKDQG